ncbi:unnamed protein product [Sphagnum balticum]
MGSTAVVHLFVSLQGRPPDLDAEKEGATSPDQSSLVAHTRRRWVLRSWFVSLSAYGTELISMRKKKLGSAHTRRRWGRAWASSLRQLVGRAPDLDGAKEDAVHCVSWIDAVWERKHQTVAGSGRGSPLRQLARRSRDLTLVHQLKTKDGRCC